MAKLDELKEHIGALKAYLNIIVAIILTVGAGISKLYLLENTSLLFWVGVVLILVLCMLFIIVSKSIHKSIKKLKDL